jgi:hypothetical protein
MNKVKERIRELDRLIKNSKAHTEDFFLCKERRDLIERYPNLDSIQDNCVHGYVLPDRCRYWSNTGCDCGAYPPLTRETALDTERVLARQVETTKAGITGQRSETP